MRTRKRGKKLMAIVGIVLVILGLLVVFFNISYSPLKSKFSADVNKLTQQVKAKDSGVFSEADIHNLPLAVQKYFRQCKFIGTKKMSYMKAEYHDVAFKQGKNGSSLKIDYVQYNFVDHPNRIALITSSMFGVPFDGYDSFMNGHGGMKGVVGKLVTIFNQTGSEMDKACLATYLSECLLVPNAALQDDIQWESIDDTHAKATMTYQSVSVQGIFTFSQEGEMLSFTTNDRPLYNTDGSIEHVSWSAVCNNYQEQNGYLLPTKLEAVWHYNNGDFVYFDGSNIKVEYH